MLYEPDSRRKANHNEVHGLTSDHCSHSNPDPAFILTPTLGDRDGLVSKLQHELEAQAKQADRDLQEVSTQP